MTAREQLADVIEDAIDSVHDMDVTHRDYANASADAVRGMVRKAVMAEREACARVAEKLAAACDRNYMPRSAVHLEMAASDIRARTHIPS